MGYLPLLTANYKRTLIAEISNNVSTAVLPGASLNVGCRSGVVLIVVVLLYVMLGLGQAVVDGDVMQDCACGGHFAQLKPQIVFSVLCWPSYLSRLEAAL